MSQRGVGDARSRPEGVLAAWLNQLPETQGVSESLLKIPDFNGFTITGRTHLDRSFGTSNRLGVASDIWFAIREANAVVHREWVKDRGASEGDQGIEGFPYSVMAVAARGAYRVRPSISG